jgi:hypothetical protein
MILPAISPLSTSNFCQKKMARTTMDHHTSPKTEVKANGFSSTEFMVPRQSLKGPWTNGSQMSHDQSMAWPSNPQYHWIG